VGQHDRVKLIKGALLGDAIVILAFLRPLKEAEVNQHLGVAGLEQISRSRNLAASGAVNCDLHVTIPVKFARRKAIEPVY
jgi:hypothetical protein